MSKMTEIHIDNVTDIELDGIDHTDLPDLCDAYVDSAVWKDTGKKLTEDELHQLLEDNEMVIHEMAYLQAVGG